MSDFYAKLVKLARFRQEPITLQWLNQRVTRYHQDRNVPGSVTCF